MQSFEWSGLEHFQPLSSTSLPRGVGELRADGRSIRRLRHLRRSCVGEEIQRCPSRSQEKDRTYRSKPLALQPEVPKRHKSSASRQKRRTEMLPLPNPRRDSWLGTPTSPNAASS